MRDLFERVFPLQDAFSAAMTPGMRARGVIIEREIPAWIRQRLPELRRLVPGATDDLEVEGSDGSGSRASTPWVRVYSQSRSPSAPVGWYVVYLFSADGRAVSLSLMQGSTTWVNGQRKYHERAALAARAAWARNALRAIISGQPRLSPTLDLGAGGLPGPDRYEAGNVVAIRYGRGSLPSNLVLEADLSLFVRALGMLYLAAADQRAPGESAPEVADAETAQTLVASPLKPLRLRQSHAERVAIEQRAVKLATQHLIANGYDPVSYVGDAKSHDIEAVRDGQRLLVEVKGTTSDGSEVVLTRNEVQVYGSAHPNAMILVVSGIKLTRGPKPVATGGELRAIHPWSIDPSALTPLTYRYALPSKS